MILKYALIFLYAVSVVAAPWYVVVAGAVVLVAYYQQYAVALLGALVFDSLYGGSNTALGVPFLYTLTVAIISLVAYVLRARLLE